MKVRFSEKSTAPRNPDVGGFLFRIYDDSGKKPTGNTMTIHGLTRRNAIKHFQVIAPEVFFMVETL